MQRNPTMSFSFGSTNTSRVVTSARPSFSFGAPTSTAGDSSIHNETDQLVASLIDLAKSFQTQTLVDGSISDPASSPQPAATPITFRGSNVTFGSSSVTSAPPGGVNFPVFGSSTFNPIQPSGSFSFGSSHIPPSGISTVGAGEQRACFYGTDCDNKDPEHIKRYSHNPQVQSISFGTTPAPNATVTPLYSQTKVSCHHVPPASKISACKPNFPWKGEPQSATISSPSVSFGSSPPVFTQTDVIGVKHFHPSTSSSAFDKALRSPPTSDQPMAFSFGTFSSDAKAIIRPPTPTRSEASATETSIQRLLRDRQALPCCFAFLDVKECVRAACISQAFRIAAADPVVWSHSSLTIRTLDEFTRVPKSVRSLVRRVRAIDAAIDPIHPFVSFGFDRVEEVNTTWNFIPGFVASDVDTPRSILLLRCRSTLGPIQLLLLHLPQFGNDTHQEEPIQFEWMNSPRLRKLKELTLEGSTDSIATVLQHSSHVELGWRSLTTLELSLESIDKHRWPNWSKDDHSGRSAIFWPRLKSIVSLTSLSLFGGNHRLKEFDPKDMTFLPPGLVTLIWSSLSLTPAMVSSLSVHTPILERLSISFRPEQEAPPQGDLLCTAIGTLPKLRELELNLPKSHHYESFDLRPLWKRHPNLRLHGCSFTTKSTGASLCRQTPLFRSISIQLQPPPGGTVSSPATSTDPTEPESDFGFSASQLLSLRSLHGDHTHFGGDHTHFGAIVPYDFIASLQRLEYLQLTLLEGNQVPLWNAVSKLPKLQSLHVTATIVSDESGLSDALYSLRLCTSLRRIYLRGAAFRSVVADGPLVRLLGSAPQLVSLAMVDVGVLWKDFSGLTIGHRILNASSTLLHLSLTNPRPTIFQEVYGIVEKEEPEKPDSIEAQLREYAKTIGSRCESTTKPLFPPLPRLSKAIGIQLEP